MRRWGIRKKVLVVTLVPTLLTTLMLGLFFTYSWVNNIESLLKDRGESLSRQLAAGSEYGLFTANRSLLSSLSNALLEEQDVRSITFFGSDGSRLLHTGPGSSETVQSDELTAEHATRISRKNSTRFITPVFLQDLMIESMLDPDARQSMSNLREPLGWVVVEMSHIRTEKETYKALLISLLLILGGVILSMAIALRLSRAFTNPVFELNEAVAKLKEGKLDTRVYTGAGPEFEQLESGLNAMAEELSKAQAEMQQNIDQATEDLRETLETIEIQNIELDFARKEALEASRIKSEFLANMSHEIRTPLNGIIGFTELLLKSPLPRQQRDHLSTIRKSSEILLTIINDILDFSKIEAGKLILDRVPFQLRDIVEEVMVMLAPAAHAKNLDLVPLVYNDVPDNIMGDPLRVKQVITNLVNNAIKFTQTGEVVLRASLEEEETDSNRVTLRLSITDSGVGLSRAQQQSLFNAFSQADASTARQYGGTGLGLAISKRLVEEMGGKIGLESELGKGSTFWFTLTSELATSGEAIAPRDALRGERVIYLEQQKTTGLAVEHLLRDWGMVVDRVASPGALQEHIEEAQKSQAGYAVAIVGITRHLLNSSQYCSLVRTLEIERDCRTLLLTPTLETHDTPLSGLASGHLTKPVCRDSLYDELLLLVHGINSSGRVPEYEISANRVTTANVPRVLAVDDNDANLKLVMTLLEDCQLDAEGASSGFEALSKARQKPFDLVFMDLQMPGMDGVETTARLREMDTGNHRTPIIALTAHALSDEQERLTKQGFDGYMPKPISSGQLNDIIHEYTGYVCPKSGSDGRLPVPEVRDTRRALRPSTRKMQQDCVSVEESIQLAAGKADLAEELFSMLLEQVHVDRERIPELWTNDNMEELLECVHKLHGATRYCGVPELRAAANHLETAIKCSAPDLEHQKDQLLSAMERLQIWSDQTDWQQLFRERHEAAETT
ncbi:MAG TPA: hybrid sensor histidine kinase/response regulator [Marinobacter adhaerens]|jgi:two-component system sensor histidine kinase BarA|uniref:ATP-binding protein n=1 Tax=unclassified Marinobacter TaxID=83889 RepID=UPI00069EE34C|nr:MULTISPECIES: ATP-binding protein [unclassified Marinobacter]AKV97364.1 histidine kinase [Marinobacter sp. CP1]MCW9008669.1 ATP-binding protein [Marinobacter sp.]HBI79278.1 hybrid sensor histidine kinase/response regulator [Marinobacter adhaerens]|tara:strand:+ start:104 stop:2977 length:2874 start_codon:yes stop_codon:yes gene_type:complete